MLVLGNPEKIVYELINSSPTKDHIAPLTNPDYIQSEQKSLTSIIDFEKENLLGNNSFSLKSIKKKAVDKVEREVIGYVLEKTDWNRSKASKILKVSYKTLLNKIAELGIEPPSGQSMND
jgi:DNA-binding NtrC family response regulator